MSGFRAHQRQIDDATIKVDVEWNGAPVTMRDALSLLVTGAEFRSGIVATLCSAPFKSYFWETPAATKQTSGRSFEFVLVARPN